MLKEAIETQYKPLGERELLSASILYAHTISNSICALVILYMHYAARAKVTCCANAFSVCVL